jgi:uncharacterized protein YicC (UPF0701 family)
MKKENKNNLRYQGEYQPVGCFNLVAECLSRLFIPVEDRADQTYEQQQAKYKERVKFAKNKNNKLIDLFCDCSHNFEESRLRQEIINYNTKLTPREELEKLLMKCA